MITAKEFFKQKYKELNVTWKDGDIKHFRKEDVIIAIEFAKLHCIKQAKVISEKATTKEDIAIFQEGTFKTIVVDKDSIINAYDLNLIK